MALKPGSNKAGVKGAPAAKGSLPKGALTTKSAPGAPVGNGGKAPARMTAGRAVVPVQSPVRHTPVAQAPMAKSTIAKAPITKASAVIAPTGKVPGVSASFGKATVDKAAADKQHAAHEGEDKILFQDYFKSIGPRTYASQLKEAKNGNHYLVVTEGKRDKDTGEVRKTRVFIYSEDFSQFFKMLSNTVAFIREHPVPDEVKKKRAKHWAKHAGENPAPAAPPPIAPIKPSGATKAAAPKIAPRAIVRAKK